MDIRGYDSMDDMLADMAAAEDRANEQLHPEQIRLRDTFDQPMYWMRPYHELGILIFGHAFSYTEACEASAKYVPARPTADGLGPDDAPGSDQDYVDAHDESLDEAVFEIRGVAERRRRGYLYGRAYSTIEPDGEYGDTHVANAWPISEQAFNEARDHGWQAIDFDPVMREIYNSSADDEFRAELLSKTTPTLIAEMIAAQNAARG